MSTPAGMQEDEHLLRQFGYEQELARRMSGFSNFAISFSIICILAGGITSFHVGLCSVGGASIGLGWPLVCAFSLVVALTMAQVASAFPTAGGLYHWGSLLGGRACGWCTAWFNLCGLITVLAAINTGAWDFMVATFGLPVGANPAVAKTVALVVLLAGQAALNHYGIRWTTRITDFSGWLILFIAVLLTLALLLATPHFEWSRLWEFQNYSGRPSSAPVFPKQENLLWLFFLGFLLPAYTITGFDASAHTSEETVGAAVNVPKGIVRSVWVSALFGWLMIGALLLAMPNVADGVEQGAGVVPWVMKKALPGWLAWPLLAGIAVAQVCCALAALTSASRMMFAFARDGGLPFSDRLKAVNRRTQTPSAAVWACAITCAVMIVLLPYETIAAIGTVFLYISYVLPVAAGFFAYGRSWKRMGPWSLGRWYRPLAAIATLGCVFLLILGVQPPNQQAVPVVGGMAVLMVIVWFALERRRFRGPPVPKLDPQPER